MGRWGVLLSGSCACRCEGGRVCNKGVPGWVRLGEQ